MACQEVYKKKCIILWWKFVLQPIQKAVRTLITNGVKEIVQNYDVDGIHMDDYFYPSFTKRNVKRHLMQKNIRNLLIKEKEKYLYLPSRTGKYSCDTDEKAVKV